MSGAARDVALHPQKRLSRKTVLIKSTPTQFQTIIYANADEEVGVKDVTNDVGKELSERQIVILKMLSLNSRISAKAISEKTSITDRTIENDLAKLKKLGILTRKGGRKDGEWLLTGLGQRVLEERSANKTV